MSRPKFTHEIDQEEEDRQAARRLLIKQIRERLQNTLRLIDQSAFNRPEKCYHNCLTEVREAYLTLLEMLADINIKPARKHSGKSRSQNHG